MLPSLGSPKWNTSTYWCMYTGVTICYIDGLFLCGDGGSRDCYTIILKDAHGLTVEDMWLEEISHLIMQFQCFMFFLPSSESSLAHYFWLNMILQPSLRKFGLRRNFVLFKASCKFFSLFFSFH